MNCWCESSGQRGTVFPREVEMKAGGQRDEYGLRIDPNQLMTGNNTRAISLAENPLFHERSKYIDVYYHYVQEKMKENPFSVTYVPTRENAADLFTKGQGKTKHQFLGQIVTLARIDR